MNAEREDFLKALEALDGALDESLEMTAGMKRRIQELRVAYAEDRPLREVMPSEETPPLVQLLTRSTDLLHRYGTRVRRTEALALHREGMTMDQIAKLFGVTRQRVSALLRERPTGA